MEKSTFKPTLAVMQLYKIFSTFPKNHLKNFIATLPLINFAAFIAKFIAKFITKLLNITIKNMINLSKSLLCNQEKFRSFTFLK